ncbi:MAG: hypothetical protein US83_C0001G0001 [Candidatus Falkowbacteria bacterium GW2011_GWC2_38_22]|uniref:Ribbon-helix-helix protein CopG domain-containing protein n=1 Tax=Candidatus Falkowbacteria bacterium GW2011_GWE1_38_31 TaxID=1618638 RepID=A0A0G0JW94_9BACT|nr:MAG: hypothetical protein US73_C0004G0127 [Candidatus Falkowbacteria bacterium GW2011_GWF2_38_1205]KKQ62067.1 MAG: hypothetical protein US83_C0001G0001 [Candidatus Falkowbacteria bacterium GW2011_GWC2_38_22]KKQ64217.1 MAG: hypothetical protein US84_C0001G0001 [Candidatus Falkowbacteria bacterium GW2011_GWF1_38_22]KKQ66194.1 MAG: hypothetical protein US87_C0002G0001 [Candidatus Falkowbacteria bacterium GW2011_GWE2_38_254]KKQ70922.1 MAG: hypothetical protein US91_C0002G0001 [Candidatus Falkowb
MNKRDNKNYQRIQFDFHVKTIEKIDKLITMTDSENRSDVIKKALNLYEYIVESQNNGAKLFIELDEEKILIAPIRF